MARVTEKQPMRTMILILPEIVVFELKRYAALNQVTSAQLVRQLIARKLPISYDMAADELTRAELIGHFPEPGPNITKKEWVKRYRSETDLDSVQDPESNRKLIQ